VRASIASAWEAYDEWWGWASPLERAHDLPSRAIEAAEDWVVEPTAENEEKWRATFRVQLPPWTPVPLFGHGNDEYWPRVVAAARELAGKDERARAVIRAELAPWALGVHDAVGERVGERRAGTYSHEEWRAGRERGRR
jgi:hypothetical protein